MNKVNAILMIEPINFKRNDQTLVNNFFQDKYSYEDNIQDKVKNEFTNVYNSLIENKINVIKIKDTSLPETPDSIFVNNWITFHENGYIVIYPMYAENRRKEKRRDIIEMFKNNSEYDVKKIIDYSKFEKNNQFLEGTGSMVLDRKNKLAYAALSDRTNKDLFLLFCKNLNYNPIYFNAFHKYNNRLVPIYHTNVMMSLADNYSVICLESITNKTERTKVINSLVQLNKEIVEISEKQLNHFAGNILQVKNDLNSFLLMSDSAYKSLNDCQIDRIQKYNSIISFPIPTIEKYGGGSIRCLMAEVFLKRKK
jgi:hypothetical protein